MISLSKFYLARLICQEKAKYYERIPEMAYMKQSK